MVRWVRYVLLGLIANCYEFYGSLVREASSESIYPGNIKELETGTEKIYKIDSWQNDSPFYSKSNMNQETQNKRSLASHKRFLSSCNCLGVSEERPNLVYVSNTTQSGYYNTLENALSNGACCEYNLVTLTTDIQLLNSVDTQYIVNNIVIQGDYTIYIQNQVSFEVQGLLLIKNVKFIASNSLATNYTTFFVSNNGSLILESIVFEQYINNLVEIEEGTVIIKDSSIHGIFKGAALISASSCTLFCHAEIDSFAIQGSSFGSAQLITGKNLYLSLSNIKIEEIKSESVLIALKSSKLAISSFNINNSAIGQLLQLSISSTSYINSSTFTNTTFSSYFINLRYLDDILVNNSYFELINSHNSKGILVFQASIGSITNTQFNSFNSTAIFSEYNSRLSIESIKILNKPDKVSSTPNQASNQQAFLSSGIASSNSFLTMIGSTIENMNSIGISIIGYDSDRDITIISKCYFINCNSSKGGAIYALNTFLLVQNNLFLNNSAVRGGAVYSESSIAQIVDNQFTNNSASLGGGIFWTSNIINETGNVYSGNHALNGNDKASIPAAIVLNSSISLIYPGKETSQCLSFFIKDYYNQTVTQGNLLLYILLGPSTNSSYIGSSFIPSKNGTFELCNFTVYGAPNSVQTFRVSIFAPAIEKNSYSVFTDINFVLGNCSAGDIISVYNNSCTPCEFGKYTLYNNETQCSKCPNNALCYQNSILPLPGYWHSSNSSTSIFECINPDSCLGGNQCAKGYTGNLCAVCETGYTQSTSNTCEKCPSTSNNILLFVILTLLFISIICYIIYRTYEDAYELKLYHSVLIKILTNYFQLMIITSVLKMRWPQPFYQLIAIQEQIGSSTGKLLSVDCLLQNSSGIQPFFFNIYSSLLGPIVLWVGISLVWIFISIIKMKMTVFIKPYVTSLVVVFFIIYPEVSNTALSVFSCHEIEPGEYWNIYAFDIQCYTSDYQQKYYGPFILTIILWTIGMPVLAYTILWRNKKDLELPITKAKYGFLYHGYHLNRYYWEFVIMFRKLLIICVALLLRTSTVSLQLIFVILVLVTALVLNLVYKPFELEELNVTESYSIGLSIVCLISGLMVESEASYPWHIILFSVLVVCNFLFFCYFAKRVYQAIGHYLWSSCPNIARTLCPKVPRPKIKIKEMIQKETRKSAKYSMIEPHSGFVDSNKEVIVQICNMRNYIDFYNEVLAARFSSETIESIEGRENDMVACASSCFEEHFDVPVIEESRPFYKRIFKRKKKLETVKEKIEVIRRRISEVNAKKNEDEGNREEDIPYSHKNTPEL
jgi:predicted outer membrane repeat protein